MRSTFGIWGAYFAVFVRGVVACICEFCKLPPTIYTSLHLVGFGTQSFQGGQCVASMIEAIWPSFKKFPNHIPLDSHVTSAQLLTFFLFIIIQLPLLYLHVSKLRYLFMAKTFIMPVFGMTLFIWALVAGKLFENHLPSIY
jgi:NCS1 family nucleobase:cation symporter-1